MMESIRVFIEERKQLKYTSQEESAQSTQDIYRSFFNRNTLNAS